MVEPKTVSEDIEKVFYKSDDVEAFDIFTTEDSEVPPMTKACETWLGVVLTVLNSAPDDKRTEKFVRVIRGVVTNGIHGPIANPELKVQTKTHKKSIMIDDYADLSPVAPEKVMPNLDPQDILMANAGMHSVTLFDGSVFKVYLPWSIGMARFTERVPGPPDGARFHLVSTCTVKLEWTQVMRRQGGAAKRPLHVTVSDQEKVELLISEWTVTTRTVPPREVQSLITAIMKCQQISETVSDPQSFEDFLRKLSEDRFAAVTDMTTGKLEARRKLKHIIKTMMPDIDVLCEGVKTLNALASLAESNFFISYVTRFNRVLKEYATINHDAFKQVLGDIQKERNKVKTEQMASDMATEMINRMSDSRASGHDRAMTPYAPAVRRDVDMQG